MPRLIIASAAQFEISPVIDSLSGLGIEATVVNTGVGLTESSIVASRLRDLVSGRDVIFCCTGGVIGSFSTVEIFRAISVELAPHDVRNGATYLLNQYEPKLSFTCLPMMLPERAVYGSLGISREIDKSPSSGEPLETIELYGVARAWLPVAKSFTAIVASTNAIGPQAHEQWAANFIAASKLTASFLARELPRLGFATKGAKHAAY